MDDFDPKKSAELAEYARELVFNPNPGSRATGELAANLLRMAEMLDASIVMHDRLAKLRHGLRDLRSDVVHQRAVGLLRLDRANTLAHIEQLLDIFEP